MNDVFVHLVREMKKKEEENKEERERRKVEKEGGRCLII